MIMAMAHREKNKAQSILCTWAAITTKIHQQVGLSLRYNHDNRTKWVFFSSPEIGLIFSPRNFCQNFDHVENWILSIYFFLDRL